ncbi:MAG: hypothetical protein KBA86_04765 [Bacteroidales bacterium]|nr:hypothetical protein [Bacteroidales bacterium]
MKNKYIHISIFLSILLTACIKEPKIVEILSNEDITIVPYAINESIDMLNASGNVLTFIVNKDSFSEREDFFYVDDDYTAYTFNQRCVEIYNNNFHHSILFRILPNKTLYFEIDSLSYRLEMKNATTSNDTIHNVLYKEVYTLILNRFNDNGYGTLPTLIKYNESHGLLALEFNNGEYIYLKTYLNHRL